MEQNYPKFTKEMKETHTILVPNMAVMQFAILKAVLEHEGYKVEVLGNCGSEVAQLGLKYVHNDTCYPALLVIGQFLDALNSGKYDLDHTALLITQTGGGCRASNYIHLLRKALVRAGYENIVCAQPFGCLPNHICGKGMINKIRALYPEANITPIDYDPSATRVNQENRIKLMLAVARDRLPKEVPLEELREKTAAEAPARRVARTSA